MESTERSNLTTMGGRESNNSFFANEETSLENSSFVFHNMSLNDTEISGDWKMNIKPLLDYLLLVILIVVMLAMGCEITFKSLLHHFKRPVGLCIGTLSQFVIVPLSAFSILVATGISGLHATGVLLISCCPGGVLSNTFTYFCEGDLSLSVAMTCASTVLALGMMPANIWLYGRRFESEDLLIPYQKMAMSLISVTSPVAVGMLLKWKFPRVAAVTTKIGSYCGLLLMFVCIAIEVIVFPDMFLGVTATLYMVILSLPLIGLSLGYGLATLCKRTPQVRKTIAIECGVQNVPVALTIIALSFPLEMQKDIVLLPWLYGFAMCTGCSVICLTYHVYKRIAERKSRLEKTESAMNKDFEAYEAEELMNTSKVPVVQFKISNPEMERKIRSSSVNI